jgi:hypothetical protein
VDFKNFRVISVLIISLYKGKNRSETRKLTNYWSGIFEYDEKNESMPRRKAPEIIVLSAPHSPAAIDTGNHEVY